MGSFPKPLAATVFDMYVNAGGNAVKILQRLLRDMGQAVMWTVLGAAAIARRQRCVRAAPHHIVDAYGIARRNYYFRIGDRRIASRKYARTGAGGKGGWITRAEEFISRGITCRMQNFSKGSRHGLDGTDFGLIFGGGRNVIRDTAEVFRENAEHGAARQARFKGRRCSNMAASSRCRRQGGFDRFMDGVNRVPRPALALGTMGLFVSAMVNPLWFAERMQGIALVPEPLWWLLGAIVSFYFGARHQVKSQQFQREIVGTMAHVAAGHGKHHRPAGVARPKCRGGRYGA